MELGQIAYFYGPQFPHIRIQDSKPRSFPALRFFDLMGGNYALLFFNFRALPSKKLDVNFSL